MYKVKVVETVEECRKWIPSWEKIIEKMDYPSPFLHPDWVLTALKVNEEKWVPYIVLIMDDGKLTGILPLYKNKFNLRREIRCVGDRYHPDPLGFCCNAENRGRSIDALKRYLFQCKGWDVLRLKWIMPGEAAEWDGAEIISHTGTIAPFLILPESFDVYLNSFKRKKRYNLNASVKKFEKLGGYYCIAENNDVVQNILKRLFNLHEKRSAERDIVSSFSGTNIFNFHNAILNNMEDAWLRFLEFNGKIIAVLYGFLFHGRFFYYQIAHDPLFRIQSPGTVLLYKVIKECCDLGVLEFNFLQGDEPYKWQWTKDSRTLYMVTMYNRTFSGALLKQKDKALMVAKNVYSVFKSKPTENK